MIIIRWFALDSVFVVFSIQVFLYKLVGNMDLFNIFGLCCTTSLFYLMDRWVDLKIVKKDLNNRHYIYEQKTLLFILSIIILSIISFVFWWQLTIRIKQLLLLGFFCYVGHLIILTKTTNSIIKNAVVSIVFTMVMVSLHMEVLHFSWVLLILLFTYLNLHTHYLIEAHLRFLDCRETLNSRHSSQKPDVYLSVNEDVFGETFWERNLHAVRVKWRALDKKVERRSWRFETVPFFSKQWMVCSMLVLSLVFYCFGIHYAFVFFVLSLIVHGVLIKRRNLFWYEIGEVAFALPFILGYGLI